MAPFALKAISQKTAREFVHAHHRHSSAPPASIFQVGVTLDDVLVGVAIGGRPSARLLCNGETIEITRLCTDGTSNASSFLYGAACRAAKNLGYTKAITYTLQRESGASLRAAGWKLAHTTPKQHWHRTNRPREIPDMFGGKTRRIPEGRFRWEKML